MAGYEIINVISLLNLHNLLQLVPVRIMNTVDLLLLEIQKHFSVLVNCAQELYSPILILFSVTFSMIKFSGSKIIFGTIAMTSFWVVSWWCMPLVLAQGG